VDTVVGDDAGECEIHGCSVEDWCNGQADDVTVFFVRLLSMI
jgi:hypothetical protein